MTVNWPLLYKDLSKFRAAMSFNELAREWDMPASTFTRLKQGKSLRAETLVQLVNGMEQDLGKYVSHPKRMVKSI